MKLAVKKSQRRFDFVQLYYIFDFENISIFQNGICDQFVLEANSSLSSCVNFPICNFIDCTIWLIISLRTADKRISGRISRPAKCEPTRMSGWLEHARNTAQIRFRLHPATTIRIFILWSCTGSPRLGFE